MIGSPEEVVAQLERLAYVPVKPISRISMSRPRIIELRDALDQTLTNQDLLRKQMRQAGQGDNP